MDFSAAFNLLQYIKHNYLKADFNARMVVSANGKTFQLQFVQIVIP